MQSLFTLNPSQGRSLRNPSVQGAVEKCETGVYDCGDLTMVADVEKRETLEYMSVKAIPALLCQPFICRLEFSPLLAATFLLAAIF